MVNDMCFNIQLILEEDVCICLEVVLLSYRYDLSTQELHMIKHANSSDDISSIYGSQAHQDCSMAILCVGLLFCCAGRGVEQRMNHVGTALTPSSTPKVWSHTVP